MHKTVVCGSCFSERSLEFCAVNGFDAFELNLRHDDSTVLLLDCHGVTANVHGALSNWT